MKTSDQWDSSKSVLKHPFASSSHSGTPENRTLQIDVCGKQNISTKTCWKIANMTISTYYLLGESFERRKEQNMSEKMLDNVKTNQG